MVTSEFANIDLHLNEFIPFVPAFTGHTQTVLGHILPSPTKAVVYQEYILRLDDGDEILLEYIDRKATTTVSIYHGLGGDSSADYIRRTADLVAKRGWNVVLVNHRRANSKAIANKTYHSGRGEDACAILRWAREKFIGSQQIAVGFSMSGSILLNLLTGRYGYEQPDFAVVVNAPLKLEKAAEFLSKGFSRLYDLRFYLILKNIVHNSEAQPMPLLGRTYDIDEIYTSKVNGFLDAKDYYNNCSTFEYVSAIKTKTFVLSSYDDPFIDINDYLNAKWSANVHLTLQKYGGHMGYYARSKHSDYGHRWLDHYLGAVFQKIDQLS